MDKDSSSGEYEFAIECHFESKQEWKSILIPWCLNFDFDVMNYLNQ